LKVPSDLLLLAKALVQFQNLGMVLDQDFNIIEEAGPVITSLYRRRFTPTFWLDLVTREGEELIYNLQNFPRDAAPFMTMLKSGKLKMDAEVENLDIIKDAIQQASHRLSFAMVLASLLIGSALVLHSNNPPYWKGIPVIGLLGLVAALIPTLWLLIDYIRKKRS
jgi:ubiquinone biosynthesis protein